MILIVSRYFPDGMRDSPVFIGKFPLSSASQDAAIASIFEIRAIYGITGGPF